MDEEDSDEGQLHDLMFDEDIDWVIEESVSVSGQVSTAF